MVQSPGGVGSRAEYSRGRLPKPTPPAGVEYWALGVTFLVGVAWAAYAVLWSGGSPWDQMAVVGLAALSASCTSVYRQIRGTLRRSGTTL